MSCQVIVNCSCGGGDSIFVDTPADPTDFSMLPGGIIPTTNQMFFAPRDGNSIWTIDKNDTEWKIINKDALT